MRSRRVSVGLERATLLAVGLTVALGLCLCTKTSAGGFSIAPTAELHLDVNDEAFIVRDSLDHNDGWDSADDMVINDDDGGTVVNVYRMSSDTVDYRKEASVRGDVFELTVRSRLYPYNKSIEGVAYSFYVPAERLDGASFRAVTGSKPYNPREPLSGTLKADQPDGAVAGELRYMALSGSCGDLVMDFVPSGRSVYPSWDATENMVGGGWSVSKQGDHFVFSFGMSARWYGGIKTGKMLIYEGQYNYDEVHPDQDEWDYVAVPQTTTALAFHEPAPEGFQSLGMEPYLPARKAGWTQKTELAQAPAILGGMVTGRRGSLRVTTLPGHYLATVRFGAGQPLGPFSLTANGVSVGTALRSEPGKVESVTWPIRLRDGTLELAFGGDDRFGISALILQRFLTEHEDYAFDRGMWLIDGIPTPDKDPDVGEPGPAPRTVALSDPDDWRWSMSMVSFASSNSGSCNELNTYPQIERRIRDVVDMGFNTVICNGLHYRLNFLDKWPMIERNMKLLCEVAHRHGVRVIEHNDVPLMTAAGTGYNVMAEHPDWLQREIGTGKVSAMVCIANPDFRRWYYDWFRRYAGNTGIDGAMLDEVTFFDARWCGCRHCREQFTAETGYTLPYVDDGQVFLNKNSKLWIAWEKWRVRTATDFFKGIRQIFDEVNPQATLMTYTTHGGFTSGYGSRRVGADLVDMGRYNDFLGTEIMSRNVFDCYRPVYAYRKMKAALNNHSDRPVWGLIYHVDRPEFAYFGWALLQMNRQLPWMSSIEGYDMKPFIFWKDEMDGRNARPLSDIAMLFSRQSCQYNRNSNHASEAGGYSQVLTDAHIQHDFILDDELRPDILGHYKLLILPAAECISAEGVEAVRGFVNGGGSLILTGRSSVCDQDGFEHESFQLADVLGIDCQVARDTLKGPVRVKVGDREPFELQYGAPKVRPADGVETMASMVDAAGTRICPAVTVNSVNASTRIYVAPTLGYYNRQPEQTTGDQFTYEGNQPAHDLLLEIVRRAVGTRLQVEPVQVPQRVLLAAYSVGTQYAVHLLNATGVNLKPGDVIPESKPGEAFPPLDADIVFDLRVPSLSGARAVSPDYEGERAVTIARQPDGAYRVTVPAEALSAYSVVYLQ